MHGFVAGLHQYGNVADNVSQGGLLSGRMEGALEEGTRLLCSFLVRL